MTPGTLLRRDGGKMLPVVTVNRDDNLNYYQSKSWSNVQPSEYPPAIFEVLEVSRDDVLVRVVQDNPTTHRRGVKMHLPFEVAHSYVEVRS